VRKLALLLLPEFSNFGLAAVTEPLFIANWLAQDTVFEWRTISDDGKPVRASNGNVNGATVSGIAGSTDDDDNGFVTLFAALAARQTA